MKPPEANEPPITKATDFPIVGIGASAGGLAAFEAFFSGMPAGAEPGMAFVIVQHLAPDHKSMLCELIRRYTRMQVFQVEDGMIVQKNCAYIIPPGRDMAFLNGALQLLEPAEPRGQRLPIDFFFRSLALDQRERAIGIVLSGTGSDGTQGIRSIKAEGGMVMAQDPASTQFDGMPVNAIATGLVDFELPPGEMPAQLITYVAHAFGKLPSSDSLSTPRTENALSKIFIILRSQTGHDFSQYKPNTIHRRIERRMGVHQIDEIDAYVKFLQQTSAEVDALFRDCLIGVTSFFRDREVFQALEDRFIPKLFEGKHAGAVIRVWSAGCSTGEEAYSLAILLVERMQALKTSCTIQVFATDIDGQAIAAARAGLYPASIAADVTPERLTRFFTAEPGGNAYRIHKAIRDLLVFSEQDLVKDPPFSKLDLISCRNLMIYLGPDLQKKLIPVFHYALKPNGLLFLGTSEGVGEFDDLFVALDRKSKLYQSKTDIGRERASFGRGMPPAMPTHDERPRGAVKPAGRAKPSLRELTERAMLLQVAPVGALVNSQGEILYLHGRTGMFLEPVAGVARGNNILKMAREGLRAALASTLHKAVISKEVASARGLNVKTNGHFTLINLTVRPVMRDTMVSPEPPLYLVILEEAPPASREPPTPFDASSKPSAGGSQEPNAEARIAALMRQLQAKDEHLQSIHEELESSVEELKSSNDEMQSVNEELQSTNEELETSKEELQSVNEELATVNTELQTKVMDLSRSNNDMNNLLAGTGIGTVFVDPQLRLLRFTPAVSTIINLIPTDVGRSVAHIVSNLSGYNTLEADVQAVLQTLVHKTAEVQTVKGKWYMMRIQPYRTLENLIEGAVITFTDITDKKHSDAALNKANEKLRLAVVVRDARDAITLQDLDGRMLAWNPGAERIYGWSEAEALRMNVCDRVPPELREETIWILTRLSRAEVLESYRTRRLTKSGAVIEISIISTALVDEAGRVYAISTTERPIQGDPDDSQKK